MKKVTVRLDEKTARWARTNAAKKRLSLSRFVGELLAERMRESTEYDAAMRAFFAERPFPLSGPPECYPTREELYDRPVLRRR